MHPIMTELLAKPAGTGGELLQGVDMSLLHRCVMPEHAHRLHHIDSTNRLLRGSLCLGLASRTAPLSLSAFQYAVSATVCLVLSRSALPESNAVLLQVPACADHPWQGG